jgi:hypothetical protein
MEEDKLLEVISKLDVKEAKVALYYLVGSAGVEKVSAAVDRARELHRNAVALLAEDLRDE